MIQGLFDLSDKLVLVTGGTHGIGLAIGTVLGKAGAGICVNGHDDAKLQSAQAAYAAQGIDVCTFNFDVTNEAAVHSGIARIEQAVGTVDILVNNAGIIKRMPILDMPVNEYKQVIEVDLVAPFIVSKRVVPGMIQKGGGQDHQSVLHVE